MVFIGVICSKLSDIQLDRGSISSNRVINLLKERQ